MKRWSIVSICISGLFLVAAHTAVRAQQREDVSVQSMPPVVVKTVPQSGDTAVDATQVKEIRVTFSKNMTDGSWSWTTASKDTVLPSEGNPRYEADKRTCVVKVKLEPGKTYATWLNTERFHGFADADGHPAVPYLLIFQTKPPK